MQGDRRHFVARHLFCQCLLPFIIVSGAFSGEAEPLFVHFTSGETAAMLTDKGKEAEAEWAKTATGRSYAAFNEALLATICDSGLKTDVILNMLPDELGHVGSLECEEYPDRHLRVWVGRLDELDGSHIYLSQSISEGEDEGHEPNLLNGKIRFDGSVVQIRSVEGLPGLYAVENVDTSLFQTGIREPLEE